MRVLVRPATAADLRQMAELAGPQVTPRDLADWIGDAGAQAAWHLVETEDGRLLGFQQIGRSDALPPETCEIATFLAPAPLPAGAAARLFEATAEAARRLGFRWITARIAADNEPARIYYQSRGFRLYDQTRTHLNLHFDLD